MSQTTPMSSASTTPSSSRHGYVRSERVVRREIEGVTLRYCSVVDPILDALAADAAADILSQESHFANIAQRRREARLWERNPGAAYPQVADSNDGFSAVWGDPQTRQRFQEHLGSAAYEAWLALVPHASSLAYLTDPLSAAHVSGDDGTFTDIDETLRTWWMACTDARGIRSRAIVMAHVLERYLSANVNIHTWTSLACGTALPVIRASRDLGISPQMTLIDFDPTALAYAVQLGEQYCFAGEMTGVVGNIFDGTLLRSQPKSQIVDCMGIFEYIGDELNHHLGAHGMCVDPSSFLREAYDLLESGGMLIFGQMLDTRPNPDFTLGVVGWPFIEMRSIDEVLRIVSDAGIGLGQCQVYLPDDGVYAVYAVEKPRSSETDGS